MTFAPLRLMAAGLACCAVLVVEAAFTIHSSPAAAQTFSASGPPCMIGGTAPTISNPASFGAPAVSSNQNFDCMAWQAFISLNWPSLAGQPGVPDPSKQLWDGGTPVWQTFATDDQIFLPGGVRPTLAMPANVRTGGIAMTASGIARTPGPRLLSQRSTVSPLLNKALIEAHLLASPQIIHGQRKLAGSRLMATNSNLAVFVQADGNVLIDQNGAYAYYEELLNPVEASYIIDNGLNEAGAQQKFAQQNAIAMPPGSIEVKTTWKVLGAGDDASRFITAQAFIDGSTSSVTVGLAAMHLILRLNGLYQGAWATFQQIDNAPPDVAAAHYSFNNPECSATTCPPNVVTAKPKPTQVQQIFPIDRDAAIVNSYVSSLFAGKPQGSALPFYRLINVQWPNSSTPLSKAPQSVPLATGSPNTATLINPVLETFLQTSGTSCLGCHASATIAQGNLAANYSFLLLHAQSANSR